jgi:hypothetical protein
MVHREHVHRLDGEHGGAPPRRSAGASGAEHVEEEHVEEGDGQGNGEQGDGDRVHRHCGADRLEAGRMLPTASTGRTSRKSTPHRAGR